ncbi:MAG: hypothetical protein M1821_003173 [Bathelium mastoideum]|nr:MAG: hypothetical protein M1821_003173 [Bathelium mastoideum]
MESGSFTGSLSAQVELQRQRFQEELARRDETLASLVKKNVELETALLESHHLKEENERLKAQVDAQRKEYRSSGSPSSPALASADVDALDAIFKSCPPEAEVGADESTDSFLDLVGRISRQYRKISTELDCYKTAHRQITAKYREQMRIWKKWQRHYGSEEGQDSRMKPAGPNVSKTGQTPARDSDLEKSCLPPNLPSELSTCPGIMGREGVEPEQPSNERHTPISTQETEEDAAPEQQAPDPTRVPESADDDVPIIISERSLKRRRSNAANGSYNRQSFTKAEGNANKPVLIKEESSELERLPILGARLQRTDTLDLEGLGSRITTPKRHQRFQELLEKTQHGPFQRRALDSLRQERSISLPADAVPQSCQPLDVQKHTENDLSVELSGLNTDKFNQIANKASVLVPEPQVMQGNSRSTDGGNDSSLLGASSAAVPIDPPAISSRQESSSLYNRSAAAIPLITEDGEDPPATGRNRRGHRTAAVKRVRLMHRSSSDTFNEKHGRLQALLESPPPAHTPLSGRKQVHQNILTPPEASTTSKPRKNLQSCSVDQDCSVIKQEDTGTLMKPIEKATEHREDYGGTDVQLRDQNLLQRGPLQRQASPPEVQTPLRLLPTSALKLSDFKPNPRVNDNLGFVYKETVRSRNERRCLPGCTDPNCCGGRFRRLAELDMLPDIEPPRGLWDSSPTEDEDPDTRLLVGYLGISVDAVGRWSDEARRKEIIAARAELFANQVGKHRQQWERARSPPGYWNADFPSTQTQMEDRLEAEKREREKVEERAREARREGGKWIFRDEV